VRMAGKMAANPAGARVDETALQRFGPEEIAAGVAPSVARHHQTRSSGIRSAAAGRSGKGSREPRSFFFFFFSPA